MSWNKLKTENGFQAVIICAEKNHEDYGEPIAYVDYLQQRSTEFVKYSINGGKKWLTGKISVAKKKVSALKSRKARNKCCYRATRVNPYPLFSEVSKYQCVPL